jgi:phage RecT family recombinase
MLQMAENFLQVLEREKPEILAHLPEWLTPDRWWAMAYEVAKNPDLQKATPISLLNAFKRIADWGLELDGEEAFINVYGNEAVAQSMYKGLIRRAVEAGVIAHAVADVIKEGDVIEIISGTAGRQIVHKPAFGLKGGKRPIIGAYALFTLPNGMVDYELMELSDIEAVKAAALRMAQRVKKDATLSPAWRFQEGEMCKKSVLRRGLKRFRGKRDSASGQRFNDLMDTMRHTDPIPGDEPPPDDLPTPKAVVAEVVDGAGRVEDHAGAKTASISPESPQGNAAARSGGATEVSAQGAGNPRRAGNVAQDSSSAEIMCSAQDKANIRAFCDQHKIKDGVFVQAIFDYAQVDDVLDLKASMLPGLIQHLEKFC